MQPGIFRISVINLRVHLLIVSYRNYRWSAFQFVPFWPSELYKSAKDCTTGLSEATVQISQVDNGRSWSVICSHCSTTVAEGRNWQHKIRQTCSCSQMMGDTICRRRLWGKKILLVLLFNKERTNWLFLRVAVIENKVVIIFVNPFHSAQKP